MLKTILASLIIVASPSAFSYSGCSQTQILNVKDLSCSACPTNMIPNPNQDIPTSCVCEPGYYPDTNHTCTSYGLTCSDTQYIPSINRDGSYDINTSSLECTDCDQNAYPNINKTGCTPCPRNMKYSDGQGCVCNDNSLTYTTIGCFNKSYSSSLNIDETNSAYADKLKYLFPGCYYFKDLLSCSELVNLCTYSYAADTPECNFFNASSLQSYMYQTGTNDFYLASGAFTKDTTLVFKLIYYLPTGNYVGESELVMPDIMRCGMPNDNSVQIRVGNNIKVACTFNFDYLVQKMSSHTYKNYVYEMFIQGVQDVYYPVFVYLNGDTKATRRFFLEDTSDPTLIKVLTSLKLSLSLNSSSYIINPQLYVSYTELSVQDGAITPSTNKQQEITYEIAFIYDTTNFWSTIIPIFIVVSVLALVQSIIRSYIAYLNRQSPLRFFLFFTKFWSIWMFYFLLCVSGYWFLFSKTTQQLYIFVPSSNDSFYTAFYVVAAAMGVLRILSSVYQKAEKLDIQVFMINWEKNQFRNCWRQIFIINSLAEFYTHRTISLTWMLMCVMFFLVGLFWDNHAAEVTHTDLTTIYSFNPINRVFLYFLAASIFLIVGIIFKILRRLSVLKWPYPFEDFVDYCNVTNISFFFMKKKSPQAYYIHASIPDRTQVTYKEINEAIRRGLNKNRSIANQHSFHDSQRMYSVYICRELEDKFNAMTKKLEEEKHEKQAKYSQKSNKKSKGLSTREEFIDKKLKPYLEVISREGSSRNKTITEGLFGFPPLNLRDGNSLKNKNQVIFDDRMEIVSEIFPNGNEFQQIHNIMITFLMFVLLTANITAAAFITYFIDTYIVNGWISNSCRKNLEKMTKVKEGFML